jgi:hypothetical protein
VSIRDEPLVVSRSEEAILRDMGTLEEEEFAAEEARAMLSELLEDLHDVPPLLRRSLEREVRVDLDAWERRIRALLNRPIKRDGEEEEDQEDLFAPPE